MDQFFTILKKDFLLAYPFLAHPASILKDKKIRNHFIGFLVLTALTVGLGVFVFYYGRPILDMILLSGYAEIVIEVLHILYWIVTALFGFSAVIGTLYASDDIKIMQRLPLDHKAILGSRIVQLTISSFSLALLFPIAFTVYYGILHGESALFYVNTVGGTFALTLALMSVITLILVLLMKFVNRIPNLRNTLQFLSMFFGVMISVGLNVLGNRFGQRIDREFGENGGPTPQEMMAMFKPDGVRQMLAPFTRWFAPIQLWVRSIFSDSSGERVWLGLAILAGCLAIFALVCFLGARPLMDGVRSAEVIGTGKKSDGKGATRGWRQKSPTVALALREIGEIFRTPAYAFNIIGGGILVPAILAIVTYTSDMSELFEEPEVRMFMQFILTIYRQPKVHLAFWLALSYANCMFMGIIGQSAISSVSREGKRIWLPKTLPFTSAEQTNGRLLCSMVFGLWSTVPALLMAFYFLKPTAAGVAVALGTTLIMTFFGATLALFIDTMKPYLTWMTAQQAVKNNINHFFLSVGSLGLVTVLIIVAKHLIQRQILSYAQLVDFGAGVVAVHLIIALILYGGCKKNFRTRLIRYEA